MKSGYGFTTSVTATIDTDVSNSDARVTGVSRVYAYFPDDNYQTAYELVKVSQNGRNSTWEFPANPKSKIGAKRWYVPVEYPDKQNYVVKFRAEGAQTPKGDMFAENLCEIYIDGNMYEDDNTISS